MGKYNIKTKKEKRRKRHTKGVKKAPKMWKK